MKDDGGHSKMNIKKILVILGDPSLPDLVKKNGQFNPEDLEVVEKLKQALALLPGYEFFYLNNHQTLKHDISKWAGQTDLVLNFCDEGFYNIAQKEKDISEILQEFNLPYTGAGPDCMVNCFDKAEVLQIATKLGISVPKNYHKNAGEINFPVLLKPTLADGGLGITQHSVVQSHEDLKIALEQLMPLVESAEQILIQEFLIGQDLTIGIVGNEDTFDILPIIEEDYSALPDGLPPICGYEAKWLPESPYWQITSKPAQLTMEQKQIVESGSLKLFKQLQCHDYARFDWRLDRNEIPKLLEANPNCGWCWDGHLNKMAGLAGWSYEKLLLKILKSAQKRYNL